MSMVAALSNVAGWRERQRARQEHERLENDDERVENRTEIPQPSPEEETTMTTTTTEEVQRTEEGQQRDNAVDDGEVMVDVDLQAELVEATTDAEEGQQSTRTMTLAELEEERELARRRTSACVLLAVFVLFRLWIEAFESESLLFLLFCMTGTVWAARWIRYNREREEELDRRIANYLENSEPGVTEVNRNDLRMLSFQAQLALAIMESQRQMMQGGFGHPDGTRSDEQGVSDSAKEQWEHFAFTDGAISSDSKGKNGYGSVSQEEKKASLGDVAHCSICLSEYENGEKLVQLPCHHIYHEECVSSWTSNHTRCPLCNFDLESVAGSAATDSETARDDSIV